MKAVLKAGAVSVMALSVASAASANCFDLSQHIPPGPFFGTAIQVDSNTVVSLTPTHFWWAPSTPASNGPNAEMVTAGCFGGPSGLFLNNTNLTVQIKPAVFRLSRPQVV